MRKRLPDNTFCIPIITKTKASLEKVLERNLATFRYAEVWLDYIRDLDVTYPAKLVRKYPGRLIFLFRRRDLRATRLSTETKQAIIQSLAKKNVLLDLDINANHHDITRLRAEPLPVRLILSYHNYSKTPSDTQLRSIMTKMKRLAPHIVKISVMCQSPSDALRLLKILLTLKATGQRAIILGMGEHGAITRIFGTMWGNEMVFAPVKKAYNSAPGQIPVDKLDSILRALR